MPKPNSRISLPVQPARLVARNASCLARTSPSAVANSASTNGRQIGECFPRHDRSLHGLTGNPALRTDRTPFPDARTLSRRRCEVAQTEAVGGLSRAIRGTEWRSPAPPPGETAAMATNITEEHRRAFDALTGGEAGNFCLFSCFVSGEPAAAIAAVTRCPPSQEGSEPDYLVTPAVRLRDAGHEPGRSRRTGGVRSTSPARRGRRPASRRGEARAGAGRAGSARRRPA